MIKLLITVAGLETDYTKYLLANSINITESINIPSQCTFSLQPIGAAFQLPPQRAYVRVYSTLTDKSLFTGFVASAPVNTYLGNAAVAPLGGQLFQYDFICTSDEYLLNIKALPFIPAYVNRTQGQILTDLANQLCPGFFDCSLVGSGDIVPFFQYDPSQGWSELAKTFGDGCRYRYKVKEKKIWYTPYGDQPLGIDYNEATQRQGQFNPKALLTTVLSVPIVNDVTIVGDSEAGNNHEDYFLGDGFTANFPLLHKVFHGYESLLLQESWNEQQNGLPNSQQWTLQDPGVNFDFSAGALNVTDTLSQPFDLGVSYLLMQNGLEIAGGIDTQVGECIWADYSEGVLGGIYSDTTLTGPGATGSLLAGWKISTPSGAVTSASGASGIVMQPWLMGSGIVPVSGCVVSQINHSYVLQIVVHAPKYSRYDRIYRTIEGEQFGGDVSDVNCNITWTLQDYNIALATGFFYAPTVTQYSANNITLPAFAVYALVNNQKLNVSITDTTVALMPLGGLNAIVGPSGLFQPTGLILPMLPANSGGYIGPVPDWPSPASASILLPPGMLATGQQVLVMGNGFDLQAAQITQGNSADTLAFYAQTEPAAGTPVRFQSWETQAAVSRLQASGSIVEEAYVVGDDGIRSAIVTNLNPLPRTSEDCDNAALAYLQDRIGTYYNGTYTWIDTPNARGSFSLNFKGLSSDLQYWPTVGRFLNVNAPRRGINDQKFLVTQLTVTINDLTTETIQWVIQFGADLFLEKVLFNFVDLQPVSVLTPTDTANPPNPRYTQNVDNSFLPDLNNVQVNMQDITTFDMAVNVYDGYEGPIEVRRIDSNWGRGLTPDYIGTFFGPYFRLQRQQYDQQWFLRPVSASGSAFNVTGGLIPSGVPVPTGAITGSITSRRSKVLRVRWPLQPAPPLFVGQNGTVLQFNFNGDMRNIYGFELRAVTTSGIMVIAQKPIASYADMAIDVSQTPFGVTDDFFFDEEWVFQAYFFNANWQYSKPLEILADNLLASQPGILNFTPALGQYGLFGATGVSVASGTNITQFTEMHMLIAYVDETTASELYFETTGTINATDPTMLIGTGTVRASGGLSFQPGDFIVANDPGQDPNNPNFRSYEVNEIIEIQGGAFYIQRQLPGATVGVAAFGSFMSPHASGTRYYRAQRQHWPFKIQPGTPFTSAASGGLPSEYWVTWPSTCVVGVMLALGDDASFGPATYESPAHFAYPFLASGAGLPSGVINPPAPGMRTLTGNAYPLSIIGPVASGANADTRIRLQDGAGIRCIYATLTGPNPPGASGLVIDVQYIEPLQPGQQESDRRVGLIEEITIPVGSMNSYDPSNPPKLRRMPYVHPWPTTDIALDPNGPTPGPGTLIFAQDGDLDLHIVGIDAGSGALSGLVVYVQT